MTDLQTIKRIQSHLGVAADGIIGPKTLAAIAAAIGLELPSPSTPEPGGIPSQSEVRTGKSIYGAPGQEQNLVSITPPYPLFYEGKQVKTIRVHKVIASRVEAALQEVLDHYGLDRIHELHLDRYSGSYNYRSTTSGTRLSMHAWGIALDFDAENNAYSMHKPHAALSKPECNAWWEIWERHGALSLGRRSDVDWMHLQFATFS